LPDLNKLDWIGLDWIYCRPTQVDKHSIYALANSIVSLTYKPHFQ